jgi:hypothetical protein
MARSVKKKATSRERATDRVASRKRSGIQDPRMPASPKAHSQGRYPGETPLTGEDRPADRAGRKRTGQNARRGQTAGRARRSV